MNIDDMPAGKELDALVAEKVMKIPFCDHYRKEDDTGWIVHDAMACELTGGCIARDPSLRYSKEPYSTHIAAAWEVVKKLRSLGVNLWALGEEEAGGWQADFGREFNSDHQGFAETAPLAICRAALKASMHHSVERL